MDELTITSNQLPEGFEAENAMKAALYKRAVGYDVEETKTITSDKGTETITTVRHVPGDVKAMETYLQLFG